ncbi:FAD-dependent monooxygenase [Kordiimonas aquimaris]|uniref:FAD-dependent monooxygenase n=1 Tax=Kordiimonas aquimaris TaxID=707591 RepID=UPI0021D3C77A|nr:FAD-dependent monooxygenase [Kordiimonas aquimaris]
MENIKPVLIVGSGPTGLILAAELTRRNVPCRIIDRKESPTTSSRAFTIHARTLEIFETMGIVDRYLDTGIKSFGFLFNFEGLEKKPVLDFRILRSRYPYILVYSQAETERLLREHLIEDHKIKIEWNTELSSLVKNDDNTLHVEIKDRATGDITTMDPSYVIGCDGVHSFVRKSMGLPFEGEAYEGMIMQMMDTSTKGYDCDPDWIQYFMKDQNFLLTTPLPNGNHRILISDMGETAKTEGSRVEAYQEVIDGHGLDFKVVEPEWVTQWVIWKRLANIYREGDVFLCGDSAHVHSPSGGQGMNSCIQDAWNLAWKLAMVLRGEAQPALLDTYEVERKPIAQQVIDGTDAMHDIIMAHGRGMTERMALTETPGWQTSVTELVAGISYTYRDHMEHVEGLVDLSDGPAAGDRAPDVNLSSGRRLFEAFQHTGYTLILMPSDSDQDSAKKISDQVSELYSSSIKSEIIDAESREAVAEIYGSDNNGRMYLVRPDGYIAFRSSMNDAKVLHQYLADHLIAK